MPYVGSDGTMQDKPPITQRIVRFFQGFLNFFVLFFKTLFGINPNEKSEPARRTGGFGSFGGGGGGGGGGGYDRRPPPPSGPSNRRIGRVGRMSDVCTPMGG